MGAFRKSGIRKIFISAGEASGDLHGSHLIRAMKALAPEASIACLGGPMMRRAGASVLVDNRDLAVVGLFEVFRHKDAIFGAWRKIKAYFAVEKPDLVVLIDFPDFNFLLARLAKRLGIRVFYYISPQVWAWRSGRVRTIKRLVDSMAVILPFEPAFYERYGVGVHYVGHPLLDVLDAAPPRDQASDLYRPAGASFLVGLLPGSRHSEVRSLLPILLDGALLLSQKIPGVSFILPVAPTLDPLMVGEEVKKRNAPVRIVSGDTYGVVRACDLVIAASGTATLETAILGSPMIVVYRVSKLTYRLGRRLIKVKYVSLPNIIAGRKIVPELLQYDATAKKIAAEASLFLTDPMKLKEQRKALAEIRRELGEPGVAARVAELALMEQGADDPSPNAPPRSTPGAIPHSFYSAALSCAWPLFFFYYQLRSRIDGKYRKSCLERLGLKAPTSLPPAPRIWVHALSVGEVLSVAPLIEALKELSPSTEIVFSTATETGQNIARSRLGNWVTHFFFLPHDFPWAVERVARRIKPSRFVLVETDIWPGLLSVLKKKEIPVFLVNGRISEASYRKMQKLGRFHGLPFHRFDHIFGQSEMDRERFIALGAIPERVHAAGNLKFDSVRKPLSASEISTLRESAGILPGRPAWVAGSTHEGEEEMLLDVHRSLRRSRPDLLLILAPRNIKRAEALSDLCSRYGSSAAKRSANERAEGSAVFILDTLGELSRFYALADAAFIGGSLVPFGGHNPLEAVAQGKPALWGPHLFNFREIEAGLLGSGCCHRVESRAELEDALDRCLRNAEPQEGAMGNAGSFLDLHSGCSRRIARFLLDN